MAKLHSCQRLAYWHKGILQLYSIKAPFKSQSKLLVSPFLTTMQVPYIIPYITPFQKFRFVSFKLVLGEPTAGSWLGLQWPLASLKVRV